MCSLIFGVKFERTKMFYRIITRSKCFSNEELNVKLNGKVCYNYFKKLLGLSHNRTKIVLKNCPTLLKINKEDLTKTVVLLKTLKYTSDEIVNSPNILHLNYLTLENRYNVLKECGINNISVKILTKFLIIMNRSITDLKFHLILSKNSNVQEKLQKCFYDIEVKLESQIYDGVKLAVLRQLILNEYLLRKLSATNEEIHKIWNVYGRIRHRSLKSICDIINILKNDLKFSNEKIIKNGFVLYADVNNTKHLLNEFKLVGNENFKTIVYRRPKILMSSRDSIKEIINYIKKFEISEKAIGKCVDILTLGSETVRIRLEELNNIEEFKVLKSNPRILRLVYYQNKAKHRLNYLNEIKVLYASLDILSCGTKKFMRFTRDGVDHNKGKDILTFLRSIFQIEKEATRKLFLRHPNWFHVPVISVKRTYDYLTSKNFTHGDIYENIFILFYPTKIIEKKLNLVQEQKVYDDYKLHLNYSRISSSQTLNFCLYLTEAEFHFTGDGIWPEQSLQQVENFSSIIPNFLEKLEMKNTKTF